jgi:tetratricopeptide (TPR) repeat protein
MRMLRKFATAFLLAMLLLLGLLAVRNAIDSYLRSFPKPQSDAYVRENATTGATTEINERDRLREIEILEEIVRTSPALSSERLEAMHFLANRLTTQSRYDEAITLFAEGAELAKPGGRLADSKRYGRLLADRAASEFYAGKSQDSLGHAIEAFQSHGLPSQKYHTLCAMNLTMMKRWDESYEHLALLKDKNGALQQTMLSMVFEGQGRQGMANLARSRAEAMDAEEARAWRERFMTNGSPSGTASD